MGKRESLSNLNRKKIFLTGATGFIGSHLLKCLLKQKCEVHISIRENSSLWRIENVLDKCVYHLLDLNDIDAIDNLIRKIKPDIIFHLATYGVDYQQQDIYKAIDININASLKLFESMLEIDNFRFIHTGTSSEYGPKNRTISECDLPNPRSIYGITKYTSSKLLTYMSEKIGKGNLIILRPFGVYGECEGRHKFFPQIINKLINSVPVKLTNCDQIRDYIYVDDLIDAYIAAAVVPLKNKVEIINIGSGEEICLKDIALIIEKNFNLNKKLLQFGALPYRSDEIIYSVANIKKANKLLLWKPKTSLEKGIRKTIEWYKQNTGVKI